MDQNALNQIAQSIQSLHSVVEATQAQINDLRNETGQLLAEIKASSTRNEQKDSQIMAAVEAVKTQAELAKSEASSAKSSLSSVQSHIDGKISDLKSELHTIIRAVR